VVHAQRRLGARVTIEPRPDLDPVEMEVRLQPTQSTRARVINENQQPAANAQVVLYANIRMRESADGFSYRPLPVYGPVPVDVEGRYTLPILVVDGSYTVSASAKGHPAVQTHFRAEAGKDPEVPNLVLLSGGFTLAGVVVDPAGKPLNDIEVWI